MTTDSKKNISETLLELERSLNERWSTGDPSDPVRREADFLWRRASNLPTEVFNRQLQAIADGKRRVSAARVYRGLEQVRDAQGRSRQERPQASMSWCSTDANTP